MDSSAVSRLLHPDIWARLQALEAQADAWRPDRGSDPGGVLRSYVEASSQAWKDRRGRGGVPTFSTPGSYSGEGVPSPRAGQETSSSGMSKIAGDSRGRGYQRRRGKEPPRGAAEGQS